MARSATRLCAGAALAALVAFAGSAWGQSVGGSAAPVPSVPAVAGILMLDWEQLYERSAWGRRVSREIAAESLALNSENNRIADDLIAEEKALTERRAGMASAAFRAEADAFDQRATGIRTAQKAKAQALSRRFEDERQAFIQAAVPLLDKVLAARGAALVIDRRMVIRGLSQIDITQEMATLVDAEIGDGADRDTATDADTGDAPNGSGAETGASDGAGVPATPGASE